ncbi:MAG: hypothetical protein WC184_11160 [Acidimicrobiia bacterium]
MDLNKLGMGEKISGGAGILLILGILILPWHHISFGPFGSANIKAMSSPNAIWGILAFILALAVVGTLLAEKLANVELPEIPVSWVDARFYGGIAVLALLLLKLVVETSALGFGAWVNIILAAGLAYGGFAAKQESGSSGRSATPPSPF